MKHNPSHPEQIARYIQEHCSDVQFDVQHLSAMMNLSDTHIRNICKSHYGCLPHQLIERTRIQRAQEMLMSNPAAFRSIDVGYYNHATFLRAFEKVMGMPLHEWQKKQQHQTAKP